MRTVDNAARCSALHGIVHLLFVMVGIPHPLALQGWVVSNDWVGFTID
ncbi:hypothetical protein Hgul01_01289 [Herpetosiphon gulosus]|uniref:Uncharacterized protein n=1 Tax=Herpetosiphon gulosus TaxID=1973496 RepID=A0ABP9WY36_9CHLR